MKNNVGNTDLSKVFHKEAVHRNKRQLKMKFRQGEGQPSFLLYNKEETEKKS